MGFFGDIGGFFGDAAGYFANSTIAGPMIAAKALGPLGGGSTPRIPPLLAPPLPPDATDEQIRQAVLMQRRRLLLGQGQGSNFITGPLGDASSFATSKSSAGGF